jgi:hypothetical protein
MFDLVRKSLHRVITTPVGDGFLPVRLPKDFARRVNMMLGEPICNAAELERRRSARARLDDLRSGRATSSTESSAPRIAAPGVVYFEKDRNTRLFGRIKEALDARGINYSELDVNGDATAKAFVMREAKCKEDDLPIVFVATTVVGGYNDLVEWDVSGKLMTAVYGASPAAKA